MEIKHTIERPNSAKSCFFEKTEKSLVRLIKEERKKTDKAIWGIKREHCRDLKDKKVSWMTLWYHFGKLRWNEEICREI